ncbi:hypothetical protein ACFLW2_02680 [Chloroflexota bacterium]
MKVTVLKYGLVALLALLPILVTGCVLDIFSAEESSENDNEYNAPEDYTEPPIPAHFTTYTDEIGLFSIAYPPDWELALSEIDNVNQATEDILLSIDSNLPVEQASFIFIAGLPIETGYLPNVSIVCESLPGTGWAHDKAVEAELLSIRQIAKDYHEFSQVKTTIDGRKATIVHWEGTDATFGKMQSLTMITLVGKIVWLVGCSVEDLGMFTEYEDDLYHVVRSLRILR